MFLRLCQTNELVYETTALQNSLFYVRRAMKNVRKRSRSSDEKCAFLCGNAGIYAVAAAISDMNQQHHIMEEELSHFEQGFNACTPIDYNENGGDEFLVGRAGYLGKLQMHSIYHHQLHHIILTGLFLHSLSSWCILVKQNNNSITI